MTATLVGTLLTIVVAHGGTTVSQSGYEPELSGFSPRVEGLSARLVDEGTRIELDAGAHEVVVLGYQGEPFLLIDEGGAFENVLSPTTYLNRSIDGDEIPDEADPNAEPDWEKIGDGPVIRFHDHAMHVPPGQELGLRGESVFRIPMRVDGLEVTLDGRLVTLPAVSAAPWLALAAVLALVAIVSLRVTGRSVSIALVAALVVVDVSRVLGNAFGTPTWLASRWSVIGDEWASPVVGWGMLVAALVLHRVRRQFEATGAALIGAAVLAFTGGVLERDELTSPRLMSALPDAIARGAIAAVIGLGLGLALRSVLELTRSSSTPAMRTPRSGTGPNPAGGKRRGSRSRPASG